METRQPLAAAGYLTARAAAAPSPQAEGPQTMAGAGISATLSSAATNFTEALDRHEETARAAITGDADPHALVEALASSLLAVETVATVRDKVVEAYQEILRMPV